MIRTAQYKNTEVSKDHERSIVDGRFSGVGGGVASYALTQAWLRMETSCGDEPAYPDTVGFLIVMLMPMAALIVVDDLISYLV